MKKILILLLSMSTGAHATFSVPDLMAFLRNQAQSQQQVWTTQGLHNVAQGLRLTPKIPGMPGVHMLAFMWQFGVNAQHAFLCRSLIQSLRPEIERALAGGAQNITVQMTLPTGQFNRTVSAEYARELIRTYDELNRDMPCDFDHAVEGLKDEFKPSNSELQRQVDAANATVNGVRVQATVYKRPIPTFVWVLAAAGVVAVAYSAYAYFFAKEEKPKERTA